MLEKIYLEFFHNYFLNGNSVEENDPQLFFINKQKLTFVFWLYICFFMFGIILIGFAVDIRNYFINIFVLIFLLVLNAISIWYVFSFFRFSKESIGSNRWLLYPYVFLFILPLSYSVFNLGIGELYKTIPYYTFYLFFLIIYLKLIPAVNFFFRNLYLVWMVLISAGTLIWKVVFIKLDQREFSFEIDRLKIPKNASRNLVKKQLLNNKRKFKFFGILIFIFTLSNILFGVSVKSLYEVFIEPSFNNINLYIDSLKGIKNGLYAIISIVYLFILLGMYILIIGCVFFAYDYYLRTIFYDKLLDCLDK